MADIFKAFLKASRLAQRGRPVSAALALQTKHKPAGPKRQSSVKLKRKLKDKALSARPRRPKPGSFVSEDFNCRHGSLSYKLYTPIGSPRRRLPLVVMLHGCSQSAADFSAGTRMNGLADELGFLVLYPQQSPGANIARCWNWHAPGHQQRGRGEPAIIASLTQHAISAGRANPARVYIAGLSAGGAAAAIIGAAYPDIYIAVGVHSGVARGDIRSIGAAVSAMRGKSSSPSKEKIPRQLPTIVFHGDNDRIVHPSNARGFLSNLERSRSGPIVVRSFSGSSLKGRGFTRRVYSSAAGEVLLEDWTVHEIGHGWSGGSAAGSYTEPAGPDASKEMIRFFLAHRRSA